MLARFNGVALGMGFVAMAGLTAVALNTGEFTAFAILLAGMGAALGLLIFNLYPAKIFVGDVGTLSLDAIIATTVIVGKFETACIIVIIPQAMDFLFKTVHRFPSQGWWGELGKDGKLRCPQNRPRSLAQALLKLTGGLNRAGGLVRWPCRFGVSLAVTPWALRRTPRQGFPSPFAGKAAAGAALPLNHK